MGNKQLRTQSLDACCSDTRPIQFVDKSYPCIPKFKLKKVKPTKSDTARSYFNEEGINEIVNVSSQEGSIGSKRRGRQYSQRSPSLISSCSPIKIQIQDSEPVRLAVDQFKTGDKHFYNMLRPTLNKNKKKRVLTNSDVRFLRKRINSFKSPSGQKTARETNLKTLDDTGVTPGSYSQRNNMTFELTSNFELQGLQSGRKIKMNQSDYLKKKKSPINFKLQPSVQRTDKPVTRASPQRLRIYNQNQKVNKLMVQLNNIKKQKQAEVLPLRNSEIEIIDMENDLPKDIHIYQQNPTPELEYKNHSYLNTQNFEHRKLTVHPVSAENVSNSNKSSNSEYSLLSINKLTQNPNVNKKKMPQISGQIKIVNENQSINSEDYMSDSSIAQKNKKIMKKVMQSTNQSLDFKLTESDISETIQKIIYQNLNHEQQLRESRSFENNRLTFGIFPIEQSINDTQQTHKKNNSSMKEIQKLIQVMSQEQQNYDFEEHFQNLLMEEYGSCVGDEAPKQEISNIEEIKGGMTKEAFHSQIQTEFKSLQHKYLQVTTSPKKSQREIQKRNFHATLMKYKPGLSNDFVPRFVIISHKKIQQFKTENFYELHPNKPMIEIDLKDVEKAVHFEAKDWELKKNYQQYEHMFEIIVKSNKKMMSCVSQTSDRFVKRFRSSSESIYSRAAYLKLPRNTTHSPIGNEFESARGASSQESEYRVKAAPKVGVGKWKKEKVAFGSSSSRNLELNVKSTKRSKESSVNRWGSRIDIWNEYEHRMVFKCLNKDDAENWINQINNEK